MNHIASNALASRHGPKRGEHVGRVNAYDAVEQLVTASWQPRRRHERTALQRPDAVGRNMPPRRHLVDDEVDNLLRE